MEGTYFTHVLSRLGLALDQVTNPMRFGRFGSKKGSEVRCVLNWATATGARLIGPALTPRKNGMPVSVLLRRKEWF
ncbi:uncharacterized protein BDW43DRAFT_145138 [Aspergillus alliaceus]|uniref:uncharacterized protein n=1 Tax=Petromyces alliaceus TaxID=209559 RepID=UPI0012A7606B|nr:uncharacterized protein BDW43DRAFT_145138 [Aspergillus alliaceus]KAB8231072.1 hypothetical protein BDW43DRAFT_145138 [Aspergillus alliaceus]